MNSVTDLTLFAARRQPTHSSPQPHPAVRGMLIPPINSSVFHVYVADPVSVSRMGAPVLNQYVALEYRRGGKVGYLLGIVQDYEMRNHLLDSDIRVSGMVKVSHMDIAEGYTTVRNHLILKCALVTAVDENGYRMPLDAVPEAGREVKILTDSDLRKLFALMGATGKKFSFIGRFYGTDAYQPLYIADFSELEEAYHFLIAGQTGSGKSTLAKMMLALYAKNSAEMNHLIVDPVGEFSRSFQGRDPYIDMRSVWNSVGRREAEIYGVDNISFDDWKILRLFLKRRKVFDAISIRSPEVQGKAAEWFIDHLIRKCLKLKLSHLKDSTPQIITELIAQKDDFINRIYSSQSSKTEVQNALQNQLQLQEFTQKLERIFSFFEISKTRKPIGEIIGSLVSPTGERGRTVILNLGESGFVVPELSGEIVQMYVREICWALYRESQKAYRESGEAAANTLVVIDEGHNFAPRSKPDDQVHESSLVTSTRDQLVKAFVETRKFGLGWMIISTRISNLEKKLYEHCRVKMIGYDLHTGADGDLIKETFGNEVRKIYSGIPDPSDPLSPHKRVVFMVSGPITVFSRHSPEFVEVFNNAAEFLQANGLEKGRQDDNLFSGIPAELFGGGR